MVRSQLVDEIMMKFPFLKKKEADKAVAVFFEEIMKGLARGDRIELRGFGAFSVRHRDGRMGRNPKNGESVTVPPKAAPFFKAGKEIRVRLNEAAKNGVPIK